MVDHIIKLILSYVYAIAVAVSVRAPQKHADDDEVFLYSQIIQTKFMVELALPIKYNHKSPNALYGLPGNQYNQYICK